MGRRRSAPRTKDKVANFGQARPRGAPRDESAAFWPAENYHQRYLQKGGQSAEKNAPEKVRCYG